MSMIIGMGNDCDPWIKDVLKAYDMLCVAEGFSNLTPFSFPADSFFEAVSDELEMHIDRSQVLMKEDKEISYNNAVRNSAIILFRLRK